MLLLKFARTVAIAAVVTGTVVALPAMAEDGPFGLTLEGSFAEGGFDRNRYVPPVTHFVLNETPFITTEVRPIYAHHVIPDKFATQGGTIDAIALQGRVALTDRLAIIATTDGWADVHFNAVLPDTDGFLDIAFGVKYALVNDPKGGNILTAGLRYTVPIGDIKTSGIDLTGRGDGYLNPFLTGAKTWESFQAQASVGAQLALGKENWSYIHTSGHLNYEIVDGVFPFVEANAILPIDGGNEFPKGTPVFSKLSGADILDIGAPDPDPSFTLAAGARFRLTDNIVLGAAFESNVAKKVNSAFDWRATTDVVIHF